MTTVRLAIVFYSTYGTNHQMAEIAAEAARTAGAEVRLLKVRETVPDTIIAGQPAWKAQAEKDGCRRRRNASWSSRRELRQSGATASECAP